METRIDVLLKPVWFHKFPTGRIGVNGNLTEFILKEPTWFHFKLDQPRDSKITLTVEYYGKGILDTKDNLDTSIVIEEVKLNDLSDPCFVWAGIYYPNYPDYYKNKIPKLTNINYLGWNGTWHLELTVPIYTWIHKIQNLGWIYD